MPGFYCFSGWFQSKICCTLHCSSVLEVFPLASRGQSRSYGKKPCHILVVSHTGSVFAHHAWCSWPEFCGPCLPIHNHQGCICATGIWIWICYPPYYCHQYHYQICASHHWSEQWESMGQQGCISFVHWVGHGFCQSLFIHCFCCHHGANLHITIVCV